MSGGGRGGDSPVAILLLVEAITSLFATNGGSGCGVFRKDCLDLVRRISLLKHLFEEIRDFVGPLDEGEKEESCSSSSSTGWWADLVLTLEAAKRLLLIASHNSSVSVLFCYLIRLKMRN